MSHRTTTSTPRTGPEGGSTRPRRYPLAPRGIFWTIQGEGHLTGVQMVFLRLAGCSVGCPECDTDYSVQRRLTVSEIVDEIAATFPDGDYERWVWITGGEPTDHDLGPLLMALKKARYLVAVATSGHRHFTPPVDWLSVSPHDPDRWVQLIGHELKIVPGLNGLDLDSFPVDRGDFWFRYVQPMDGDPDSASRCLEWLKEHPGWAMTMQNHKVWGVP